VPKKLEIFHIGAREGILKGKIVLISKILVWYAIQCRKIDKKKATWACSFLFEMKKLFPKIMWTRGIIVHTQ